MQGVRPKTGSKVLVAVTVPRTALLLLRGQLRWLHERGYEVVVAASSGAELTEVAEREGVITYAVPMRREIALLADLRSFIHFLWLIERCRPQITHVSTPKAGLVAGLAARVARVSGRVYTMRGLRLETAHGAHRALLWAVEWLACWSAHVIVVVSPSLADRVVQLRLARRNKLVVIGRGSSNGVDSVRFAPTAERVLAGRRLRLRLGIPAATLVVGFVGRLTRDKGILELLDAFELVRRGFPETYLLVIGDTDPERQLPAGIMARLTANQRIVRLGWLADPAVAYYAMDVVALPTYREGFPNVALEAAAAGRPVVTTRATGAIDSVIDGQTGILVPPRDSVALADAVTRLLRNRDYARTLGEAGRAWVTREFVPEVLWQGVDDIYRALLTKAHRSSD